MQDSNMMMNQSRKKTDFTRSKTSLKGSPMRNRMQLKMRQSILLVAAKGGRGKSLIDLMGEA